VDSGLADAARRDEGELPALPGPVAAGQPDGPRRLGRRRSRPSAADKWDDDESHGDPGRVAVESLCDCAKHRAVAEPGAAVTRHRRRDDRRRAPRDGRAGSLENETFGEINARLEPGEYPYVLAIDGHSVNGTLTVEADPSVTRVDDAGADGGDSAAIDGAEGGDGGDGEGEADEADGDGSDDGGSDEGTSSGGGGETLPTRNSRTTRRQTARRRRSFPSASGRGRRSVGRSSSARRISSVTGYERGWSRCFHPPAIGSQR